MKAILIICDGLADRPLKDLDGKTPLEAARKPALDELAKIGINGMMDTISPGVPPGSDTAHLALLGYDVEKVYCGRGTFEALGVGMHVRPDDVALRSNFATVNEERVVVDRRAGRIGTEEAEELAKSLEGLTIPRYEDVKILFKHSIEHRGALVLRGPGLSPNVTDSDPENEPSKILEVKPTEDTAEAKKTAKILNALTETSHKILKEQPLNLDRVNKKQKPANILIFRGAGTLPKITPLTQMFKINAACIIPTALVRGVAIAAGMKPIDVRGATGTVETDTVAKAKALVKNLQNYDFFFIHVKGTDNASHDGNLKGKIHMIEKIDRMTKFLLDNLDLENVCITFTADHATPLILRKHTGDQVPITIAGLGVIPDDVESFSERACSKGGLGRIRGRHVIPIMMNLLGKTPKFGA